MQGRSPPCFKGRERFVLKARGVGKTTVLTAYSITYIDWRLKICLGLLTNLQELLPDSAKGMTYLKTENNSPIVFSGLAKEEITALLLFSRPIPYAQEGN